MRVVDPANPGAPGDAIENANREPRIDGAETIDVVAPERLPGDSTSCNRSIYFLIWIGGT